MNVIQRDDNGRLSLYETVVFHCGCGGVAPDVRNKLRMAGVPHIQLVSTNANRRAKKFIQQAHLNIAIPSLAKNKHAVLYNPKTGQFIDLLHAPKTEDVYANIYKVVSA